MRVRLLRAAVVASVVCGVLLCAIWAGSYWAGWGVHWASVPVVVGGRVPIRTGSVSFGYGALGIQWAEGSNPTVWRGVRLPVVPAGYRSGFEWVTAPALKEYPSLPRAMSGPPPGSPKGTIMWNRNLIDVGGLGLSRYYVNYPGVGRSMATTVLVPLWMPLLVTGAPTVLWWLRRRRRLRTTGFELEMVSSSGAAVSTAASHDHDG